MTNTTFTQIEIEADKSAWPLLRHERNWGPWQLGISLATAAAATWCYIIGEYVGYYLGFGQGFAALFAGSMIGMLIVTLAAVPICIRFGVDSIASAKPQFGTSGWIIPAAMQQISIVGWNSLLLIFFAKSVTQLLIALGIIADGESSVIVPATIFLACVLVFLFLLKGSGGLDRIAKILVAHVFVGFWMLYILVTQRWGDIEAAVPAYASSDPLWNYTTGVEIGIVSLLSWWPYIGAMVRMAPKGRTAAVPIMIGMGAPVPLLSLIGIAGILVLQVSDPAEWLRTVGGPTYGIVALLFVAAANLGTAVAGVYASAIGLRHFPGLDRVRWPALLLITIAPVVLVGLFIPELFFANFGSFLAFIGMAFAPLCGIQIADYFFLRGRRIDIRAMFVGGAGSAYRFWGGFNPAALLAMAAGCATYLYLLNPLTYVSNAPYDYTTATLPTLVISGLVHIVVTRLVVKPAGKGGY
ncbi:NCS1 family nucleobase:cation symporter-1 [Dongia mobilis]|uniref:NCS1 family nucleobase:cation symporter-1 n=1 Tax=Dongia mobilis TaxID=578943 RepID=A0A4R6WS82_9PROT|nr:cytosine permease [Dongia mobilis]TDQ82447.1 NCS1 family nucleobase:cation symporter-1 [Dongia mobilis]